MSQVQAAIQSRFYDPDSYAGKTCDVHIKLMQNGTLVSAVAAGGDSALCQAAITAAKTAQFPKPSPEVWEQVKDSTLVFKPQ